LVANNAMIKEFNESDSQNSLLVVLTNDNGLGPPEEAVYRTLVDNLRADHAVVMLQDFISTPALREVVTSKDHKAWNLPVGLAGDSLPLPPVSPTNGPWRSSRHSPAEPVGRGLIRRRYGRFRAKKATDGQRVTNTEKRQATVVFDGWWSPPSRIPVAESPQDRRGMLDATLSCS
jgi:hypothetical protein